MQRNKLIEYLTNEKGFILQGEGKGDYTILDNTQSVGDNVLTYTYEEEQTGTFHRVKLYNKIVSNFEAREVRSCMGGHIADYVFSSNERLRKVFQTADVQNRGITRLEVSIYGSQQGITKQTGTNVIEEVLKTVSPENSPLFVIQEARQQWNNLAEELKKCFVLVDKPHKTIYMAWYANTKTKRIAGVKAEYKQLTKAVKHRELYKMVYRRFWF